MAKNNQENYLLQNELKICEVTRTWLSGVK